MDRTVKLLLGVIAFSLVALNLQLAGVELERDAHGGEHGKHQQELLEYRAQSAQPDTDILHTSRYTLAVLQTIRQGVQETEQGVQNNANMLRQLIGGYCG